MSPPPLPAIPPPQDPAKHFYLVYGANLHRTVSLPTSRTHQLTPRAAKLLSALLGPTPPLASYTVRVPSAFLSFDFAGIPFVEPCYTSAIVRGVNDRASSAEPGGSERGEEGVEYRRWVWERCCPGLEFTGELPPALEGVAYDLSSTHVAQVVASSEPLLPVDCTIFSNGDASISLGTLVAHTLVAPPEFRKKLLQPTARYLRFVLIGSFFNTLSQPFLGHLVLLRPYEPTTLAQKLAKRGMVLLLLLPFLTGLLLKVSGLKMLLRWGGVGEGVEGWVWNGVRKVGEWLEELVGSGSRTESGRKVKQG